MTKQHYGEDVDGGRFTICDQCHAYMCVECLEKIASNMEEVEQGGRTILPDEVWSALQSRCYDLRRRRRTRLRVSGSSKRRGSVDLGMPFVRQR